MEFRRGQCLETVFNIELVGVRGSDDDNRRVTAAVTKRRGRVRPPPGDGKLLFERSGGSSIQHPVNIQLTSS